MHEHFQAVIKRYQYSIADLVALHEGNTVIAPLDLRKSNSKLRSELFADTSAFSAYIEQYRLKMKADYLAGGYNELRVMYERSELFSSSTRTVEKTQMQEPRRLHLGVDIWGPLDTPVFAPISGSIHSVAFNDRFGDYGATIILHHQLETLPFYSLYGHLSLRDIDNRKAGDRIECGELLAHFGSLEENGHWPPHLHFQIVLDIGSNVGDYPGVCKESERNLYLQNSPDPEPLLRLRRFMPGL